MLNSLFKKVEGEKSKDNPPRDINFLVVGCGGGGTNSINRLGNMELESISTVAMNTDSQHLYTIKSDKKILMGERVTRGHGTGGEPKLGQLCAEEAKMDIRAVLGKPDIVFVTVGLGGGTGTGSAPIVADMAKNMGAIVVVIATMPFDCEGVKRKTNAEEGLKKIAEKADSVIIIDNNKLLELMPRLPFDVAFGFIDQLIATIITGMAEAVTKTSLINIDFADIKSILGKGGIATILCGEGSIDNPNRVVQDTIQNSLLDIDCTGADGAVIHITCDTRISLEAINSLVSGITTHLSPDANVIFGVRQDPELKDTVKIMSIITGVKSPFLASKEPRSTHEKKNEPAFKSRDAILERRRNQRVLTLEEVLA